MANELTTLSPAGSLTGWNFSTWLKKNKDTLKLLVMTLAGIATYATTQFLPLGWQLGVSGLVSVLAKLAMDTIDYKTSDVTLG